MTYEKALALAKENEWETVDPRGMWNGYDVYVCVFAESLRGCRLGTPVFILCEDGTARFATDDEAWEILGQPCPLDGYESY